MDKKSITAIAVVIIIVAAVGIYLTLGDNDNENTHNAHGINLDGVVPSEDNIVNGTYKITRNLVLVTLGEPTGNIANFLNWITNPTGQEILAEEFVPLEDNQMTANPGAPDENGDLTIYLAGSTSLIDTMNKLANAYMTLYPYMSISIGTGGSSAGEIGAANGSCDIGMLARDMGSEYEGILVDHIIGRDGIAIVANIAGVDNLTIEQVAAVFSGKITNWSEVGGPDEIIRVITRESSSGTRECFENALLKIDPDWTVMSNAASYNSTGGVIKQIQDLKGSISYISIGKLAELNA